MSMATRLFEARTRTPKTALRGKYGPFLAETLLMATEPRPSATDYSAYIYAVSGLGRLAEVVYLLVARCSLFSSLSSPRVESQTPSRNRGRSHLSPSSPSPSCKERGDRCVCNASSESCIVGGVSLAVYRWRCIVISLVTIGRY